MWNKGSYAVSPSLNVCFLVPLSHQCPVVLKRIGHTKKQGILCFLETTIYLLYFEFLPISVFVPFLHVWCCSGGQDRNKGSYVSLGREAEWAGQASGCLACCWLEQGQEGTMRWCETNFIPSWQFHLPAYPTYLPTYLTEYIFTYLPAYLPTSREGAMCLCKTNFIPLWQFHLLHYTSTHCEAHKASGDMAESPWSLSPPNFIPSSCGNFTWGIPLLSS